MTDAEDQVATAQKALEEAQAALAAADKLACHLGIHPALIWGDAWFEPYIHDAA